jgi:signal transduction histidine kinase
MARGSPAGSFAGESTLNGLLEVTAGWSLIFVGLVFSARRRRNAVGALLIAAGFAWFLPEWSNPGTGSALVFTVGLVGFLACPPLVGHVALAYPGGRLVSLVERAVVVLGYAGGVILVGLLPAVVFDPQAEGCLECPHNLVLVAGDADAVATFTRWGLWLGLAWIAALGVLIIARLVRATRNTLLVAPVLVAAAAYLAFVARDLQHSLSRNVLSNDSFDVRLWRREAIALALLAAGVLWGLLRASRARAAVAALVVELGRAPSAGGVAEALASTLHDPNLVVVYRRTEDDAYVDPQGRPADVIAGAGRAVTPIVRDGAPVAAIVHDAHLLDDPGALEEVVAAARLAIENERFQAEVRAQVESLRTSRARIVETGDAERRRLERDLHDGAQQRLVGLALVLRMLRTRAEASGDTAFEARLSRADAELHEALAELRHVAHGIYPAILADEGLAAAMETLAEGADVAIELGDLPDERFEPPVENAAYFLVAEALRRTNAGRAHVDVRRTESRLVIEIDADGTPSDDLTDLDDRVGALDGLLAVVQEDGRLLLQAELPCE